jgi:uncharacterized protein (DUF2126 family)
VTCNGVPLNLHPAGPGGRLVGGVRYKAWDPPFSLHPTIPVSSPLVFDLIDTWAQRSLGGCRYHVAHPGGRSYEAFPVNANEAAARRGGRFWEFGHTPATDAPEVQGASAEGPDPATSYSTFSEVGATPGELGRVVRVPRDAGFTVDLRRAP